MPSLEDIVIQDDYIFVDILHYDGLQSVSCKAL